MLTRIHASHLGVETCLRKARDVIYWPIMNSEVKNLIIDFTECDDYLQNISKKPLISRPIPSKLWKRIAMDIMNVFDRN